MIFLKRQKRKVNFPGKTGKKEKKGTGKQKVLTFAKPVFSKKSMAKLKLGLSIFSLC